MRENKYVREERGKGIRMRIECGIGNPTTTTTPRLGERKGWMGLVWGEWDENRGQESVAVLKTKDITMKQKKEIKSNENKSCC